MKNLLSVLFCFLTLSANIGCSKDENKCRDVTCLNEGVCVDGTCSCPQFVNGSRCEKQARTKFYGSFTGSLVGNSGSSESTMILEEYPDDYSRVRWNSTKYMKISLTTQLNIPEQPYGPGQSVSGSGALYDSTLSLVYTIVGPNGSESFTFSGFR